MGSMAAICFSCGSTHLQHIEYSDSQSSRARGGLVSLLASCIDMQRTSVVMRHPCHMSQRAHMPVPVMMHGHGGHRGCPLAYATYRTSSHPIELWATSWIRGPISCLSSWGDVLDPLIRWTTSWIHGSISRCSPWDGDELRHHEDMHNVHSHGLRLLSRTPLRWVCGPVLHTMREIAILQMSVHGWWWTPPPRPRILEISWWPIQHMDPADPVLVWQTARRGLRPTPLVQYLHHSTHQHRELMVDALYWSTGG